MNKEQSAIFLVDTRMAASEQQLLLIKINNSINQQKKNLVSK